MALVITQDLAAFLAGTVHIWRCSELPAAGGHDSKPSSGHLDQLFGDMDHMQPCDFLRLSRQEGLHREAGATY